MAEDTLRHSTTSNLTDLTQVLTMGTHLRMLTLCVAHVSGGVLLDSRGRVIGINTAIADPTGKGASSGVGFAIPIDSVKGLVDQILKYGQVIRPVLGVSIAPPAVLQQLGLDGVLVLEASFKDTVLLKLWNEG